MSSQTCHDNLDLKTHTEKTGRISCNSHDSTKENSESIPVAADLQQEIEHLQSQLSKSTCEIKQKNKEIEKLRQTIDEERTVMSEAGLTSSITQKIVDISRKNRDLHAELGREKHKTRQLQTQVSELKEITKTQKAHIEEIKRPSDPTVEDKQREMITKLEEQLQQAKHKIVEHCNHVQLLKQDLKLAQKVLVKEVGEGVSISNLASVGDGWRGRAQLILTLQNKVTELQKQVESHSKSIRLSSSSSHKTPSLAESKQKTVVQKMETENKQKVQELRTEVKTLQSEQSELKQTIKALKSRNQTLTLEIKDYKTQLHSLSSEIKEKERTVSCLEEKLTHAEMKTSSKIDDEETVRLLRSQLSHSKGERQRLEATVSQLQGKLIQQNSSIQNQQKPTQTSRNTSLVSAISEDQRPLSSSETEFPSKLPPITNGNCKVIQKDNKSLSILRSSVSAGPPPQRKYSNEEFDQIVSLCRVTEVERDRLLGLSQLLQQRLDTAYSELAALKQQLMSSERSMKFTGTSLQPTESATRNPKGKQPPLNVLSTGSDETNKLVSQLQEKLSLQQDENNVLKETLKLTREQKLKDMKTLQNLLHETRQTLRQ